MLLARSGHQAYAKGQALQDKDGGCCSLPQHFPGAAGTGATHPKLSETFRKALGPQGKAVPICMAAPQGEESQAHTSSRQRQ